MPSLRHPFAALLALLVVSACATTQEGPKREPPRSPTFLWKVSAPDRPGTLYVLGTVHIGEAGRAELDRAVLDAVDGADRVVFEIAPGGGGEQAIGAFTQEHGLMPEGESWLEQLDEETREKLVAATEKIGFPLEVLGRTRPWLASLTLSVMRMRLDGYEPNAGVEQLLLGRLEVLGDKPVEGLEAADEQLRVFADLAHEEQLEMLRRSIDEAEEQTSLVEQLQRAYREGDVDGLAALIFAERGQSPEGDATYRALYDDRNERMVERMLRWLDEDERTVVAIGAGHVVGERGIPALLLAKGFSVEAVPALGLAPVWPEGAPPPGTFVDEAAGFAAEFHARPDVHRGHLPGHDGRPTEHVRVLARSGKVELGVEIRQLPGRLKDDEEVVEGFSQRILEGVAEGFGTVESSERVRVQGRPGVRFAASAAAERIEGLVVVRGARVYMVLTSRPLEATPEEEEERVAIIRRFLDSFRLLDEEPPTSL